MREKLSLALLRSVTMANLLESLAGAFGDREAFLLPAPLGYRRFPQARLTYSDGILFTNLAAETLIRDLDLKKGERVLILAPGGAELLLLAVAVIKAGGVAVPLDTRLPLHEIWRRAAGCTAELAIIDGRILAARADLAGSIPGVERLLVSGPRSEAPDGLVSLDEAMDGGAGFFLPYTLKHGSVVGLFHSAGNGDSSLAVMATNRGLLGIRRTAALLLPAGPGDTCICALPPISLSGFSSAVAGLCMGMSLHILPDGSPEHALEAVRQNKADVFMGDADLYGGMLEVGVGGCDPSSIKLWFSAGNLTPREHVDAFRRLGSFRIGPLSLPALFAEAYRAGESTTMVAIRLSLPGLGWPDSRPGITLPPHRIRILDGAGKKVKRGGEGELAVKGPGVTPGYWNNLAYTFETIREGWLHTGIKAIRGRFLSPFTSINEPSA